jgi:hypothetical protein
MLALVSFPIISTGMHFLSISLKQIPDISALHIYQNCPLPAAYRTSSRLLKDLFLILLKLCPKNSKKYINFWAANSFKISSFRA